MPVTEQNARLMRRLGQNLFIEVDRLLEVAEPAERRGLEIPVAKVVRLEREYVVEQLQRFARASHPAEDQREVGLGGRPVRRELDRAAEQIFRIAPAAEPGRKLGQHAD